jgi:hypothetical protein
MQTGCVRALTMAGSAPGAGELAIPSDVVRLADDASPRRRGRRWLVGIAANASAAESYFVPIRVIGVISATARSPPAEPRARPQATHFGSANRRTRTTSATPGTSRGYAPGERTILAIGASRDAPRLRYKTSHQRNPLIQKPKQPAAVRRIRRFQSRNPHNFSQLNADATVLRLHCTACAILV